MNSKSNLYIFYAPEPIKTCAFVNQCYITYATEKRLCLFSIKDTKVQHNIDFVAPYIHPITIKQIRSKQVQEKLFILQFKNGNMKIFKIIINTTINLQSQLIELENYNLNTCGFHSVGFVDYEIINSNNNQMNNIKQILSQYCYFVDQDQQKLVRVELTNPENLIEESLDENLSHITCIKSIANIQKKQEDVFIFIEGGKVCWYKWTANKKNRIKHFLTFVVPIDLQTKIILDALLIIIEQQLHLVMTIREGDLQILNLNILLNQKKNQSAVLSSNQILTKQIKSKTKYRLLAECQNQIYVASKYSLGCLHNNNKIKHIQQIQEGEMINQIIIHNNKLCAACTEDNKLIFIQLNSDI